MKIENTFVIDAPVDQAWAILTDIHGIAPCLPGAKVTGEEDGVFRGAVEIKVGPVTAEYRGTAEFVERDDGRHRAVIDGKGHDTRSAGDARALIITQLTEVDDGTRVGVSTELQITGRVARLGRGVIQDMTEKLVNQFATCLTMRIEAARSTGNPQIEPAPTAAGTLAGPGSSRRYHPQDHDEALDLFHIAGTALLKRLVPIAAVAVIVLVVLVFVVA